MNIWFVLIFVICKAPSYNIIHDFGEKLKQNW